MAPPGLYPAAGVIAVIAALVRVGPAAADPAVGVPYHAGGKEAIIRNILTYGNGSVAEPRSTIRLSYDERALYVTAEMEEPERGYPRAHRRSTMDDLTRDDAFQVVLGMADPADVSREVLRMGGYVGALDAKVTSADVYYQFTVNSAGSMSRTFNETPLRRPLFTSSVRRSRGGWTVAMRIPLFSMGLGRPEGKTLFANFFRFRPPAMTGWHLPGFGGYTGMPFGTLTFLPPGADSRATVEQIARRASPRPDRPGLQASIEYYPLSGAVVGRVTHPRSPELTGARALLQVSGEPQEACALTGREQDLVIRRIAPGTQPARQVALLLRGSDGRLLLEKRQEFAAVEAPAWFGSRAGVEYVDRRVPRPWTAPIVRDTSVTLAHCSIRFGRFGLLSSVRDGLGELLAGDASVDVRLGGRPVRLATGRPSFRTAGTGVVVTSRSVSGGTRLDTWSRMDYDGFTEVKLRLICPRPKEVSRITVRIPIAPDHARFTHTNLVQEIRPLDCSGYEAESGPLWVGDQDKGIRFSYDEDPFLSANRRSRVRAVKSARAAALEFDLVDAPGQLRESGRVFRFFLQPTPTKPRSMRATNGRVRFQWEQWTDHQGAIELNKTAALRSWTKALAADGLVGAVYTCQGLAQDDPDFARYRPDLALQPEWLFYRRAYNPGLGVPCWATCKRGPDGERVLWGLEKLIREAGIGGICDDGMSVPWEDANPAHEHGCGNAGANGRAGRAWNEPVDSRVPAQRGFLKRVRGLFDETGRPFLLTAHTGGGLDISTLSLFDGYMEGEQLARFRPGYHIPLSTFAIGYNGLPWGFRTRFFDRTWRRQQGFFWSYAYVLLFGADQEDSSWVYENVKEFQDDKTARFFPYWRPDPYVRLRSRRSLASCYRTAGAAVVTVMNPDYGADSIRLSLGGLFPGRRIAVCNLLANGALVRLPPDGVIRRTLPAWHCALYRVVVDEANASARPWRESGLVPDHWRLSDTRSGAELSVESGSNGAPGSVRISSASHGGEAALRFMRGPAERAASGALLVTHSGRLRLRFGEACISYDNGWSCRGLAGGLLFQPAVRPGQPVPIRFSIEAGILQVSYDRQPLVAGMRVEARGGDPFCVTTWAGDTLSMRPIEISSRPTRIYEPMEGLCRLANAPAAESFDVSSYLPADWAFTTGPGGARTETMIEGRRAFKMTSVPWVQAAQATFRPHRLGADGTISLRIRHTGRLQISVGAVGIMWDGSWETIGDAAGWSEARLYQPPAVLDAPVRLTIRMRDGVWEVEYGGRVVLRNARFAAQQTGGAPLTISTWAGDSVTVSVERLSSARPDLRLQGLPGPVL
jgi:hypothetical protein